MENHYANLKPYHKELPSTLALLNDLNIYEIVNNEFDDDGDEPKFVKEIFWEHGEGPWEGLSLDTARLSRSKVLE